MRKIECACGITLDIYSWPVAEIEQNGKKMMERHLTCRCKREIVVRTQPKYEPGAEEEPISTVASFAEISRQFGVLQEAPPHNEPAADSVDKDTEENEVEEEPRQSISLTKEQASLFYKLVDNYATWFKQGKASAESKKKFTAFLERIAAGPELALNDEDIRMSRMAFSERNLFHIYGPMGESPIPPNVQGLHDHFKEILK